MSKTIRMYLAVKRSHVCQGRWQFAAVPAGSVLILLVAASSLFATTLVVKLDNGRILLAADTRQERLNPGSVAVVHLPGDDERCKIRSLGGIGFAVTGLVEYQGRGASETLPDWNANADAVDAFGKAGDNIREVAADWAKRSAAHFNSLYQINSGWLKQLADTNPQNLLQVAFFTGWDKDAPLFLIEIISFDPSSTPVIHVNEQSRIVGDAPFSTNAITQELIDSKTDRAQHVADTWDTIAEGISTQDLGWRHVEFYINQTAPFDPDVSTGVDVLAIPARKPTFWLKRSACP